ncbi:MAG: hypothetical protein AAB559_03025 [Patescibacteria group bacterium]
MRKEVIFAIIAGISIGLIVAFGAWRVTRAIKKNAEIVDIKKDTPPKNQVSLAISNLYDYDVITSSKVKIAGLAKRDSDLIISTSDEDFFGISDADGAFEIEISLPAGISEVNINDPVNKIVEKIILVYSTEFEKYIKTDEKLKTTSYVGTVTDISSGTIQIKTVKGDIEQMSIVEETSYVNTLKKNTEVKSTDIAIGDYIVAMGFVNGNKVLDAKRILITSPLEENKYSAKEITIETLSKTKINDITLPKKWVGPNVSELEVGQTIIVVGTSENEKYSLRSIFTTVE